MSQQRNYGDVAAKNAGPGSGNSVYINPQLKAGHFDFYKKDENGQAVRAQISSITGFLDGVDLFFEDGDGDFAPCWSLRLKLEIPCTVGTRLMDFKTDEVPGGLDENGYQLPSIPVIKANLTFKGDRVNAMRKLLNPIMGTLKEQGLAWNGLLSLWFSPNQTRTSQMDLFVKTNATAKMKSPLMWPWDDVAKVHTGLPAVISTGAVDSQGNEIKDSRAQMNALLDAAKSLYVKYNPGATPPNIPHVVVAYKRDGVTRASISGATPTASGTPAGHPVTQSAQQGNVPAGPPSIDRASYISAFKGNWSGIVANNGGEAAFYANTPLVIQKINNLLVKCSEKLSPLFGLNGALKLSFELFKEATKVNEKMTLIFDEQTGTVSVQPGTGAVPDSDDLPF